MFTVLYVGGKRREREAQATENFHITVNNAIIDLYRDGYIKSPSDVSEPTAGTSLVLGKKDKPENHLHRAILKEAYPTGKDVISAKAFHVSIHSAREKLRHLATTLNAVPDEYREIDTPAHRLARGEAGSTGQRLLPLLFLGTPEGSDYAGNRNYKNDLGYDGASDFGGDSGGGDGGGGDGGD